MSSPSKKNKSNKKFKRLQEDDNISVATTSKSTQSKSSSSTISDFRRKVNTVKKYFCLGDKNSKSDNEECEEDVDQPASLEDIQVQNDQQSVSALPSKSHLSQQKSMVWNYFISSGKGKFYKCTICKQSLTNCNNTSNLLNHLKRKHKEILALQNDEEKGIQQNNPGKPKLSTSLREYFSASSVPEYDKNSPVRRKLDRYLAQFICNGYHALSVTDEPSFKDFIYQLNPKYRSPSRKKLTTSILPELYQECKAVLMERLNKVNSVAITADGWTSLANDNYLGITCHFYWENENSERELISSALDVKLVEIDEKAETIANMIKDVLREFNIVGKVSHIVTDNAANMKAAADILQIKHLPCFAHTLNLVIRSALTTSSPEGFTEQVGLLIKSCKSLVTFFHQSPKATRLLQNENDLLLEEGERKPTKLIQYVETRWHTLLKMFVSIIDNFEGIKRVCIRKEYSHVLTITDTDVDIIKDLILLLQPLENVTTELSGHLYISISLIIPAVKGLFIAYQIRIGKLLTDVGQAVSDNILEQLRRRLQPYESRTITRVATLLDARYGKAGFVSDTNYELSQQALRETIRQRADRDSVNALAPASTTQAANNGNDSILSFIDAVEVVTNETATATTIVRNFISTTATKKINRTEDPLEFLRSSFPELYSIGLDIFSVPASSVPAEALFSKTGLLVQARRNRLSAENVKMLTFLKYNLRFIDL